MLEISRLKRSVERQHRCRATHAGTRIIVERLPGGAIWRGKVEVFDIAGNEQTDRCYAWFASAGERRLCVTRLRVGVVRSAQSAVRAELARLAPTRSSVLTA